MTEAETEERLAQAERKIRGFEELAFSFGDILNTRTERYDAEVVEIRKRLEHLDRAVSMLQLDVRDIRSGVTLQLTGQDRRIAELARQVAEIKSKLDHQGEIQQQHGTMLQQHGGQLTSMDAKLDTIMARLGG